MACFQRLGKKYRNIAKNCAKVILGTSIGIPIFSATQGAYFLTKYRLSHGNSPHPATPSSGMVIVSPENGNDSSATNEVIPLQKKNRTPNAASWRKVTRFQAPNIIDRARSFFKRLQSSASSEEKKKQPLRLFVVGDSLAVGVGTTKSGTPILPEAIARHLSKELGGRPVQWSCVGTPGASTKRISNDIKEWFESNHDSGKQGDVKEILSTSGVNLHPDATFDSNDGIGKENYDIVVVLTGLNDMKGKMLPFLTTEEGKNDSGFKEELRQIFFLLKEKLEWKIASMQQTRKKPTLIECDCVTPHATTQEADDTKGFEKQEKATRPLMVLPALPTQVIPLFQYPPISWFVQPLFQCLDNEKKALSEEHPGTILFVEAPSSEFVQKIEEIISKGSQRSKERVVLAIKDIKASAERKIEELMREYSSAHSSQGEECETEKSHDEAFYSNLTRKMPDFLGSKLVSFDKIHPNDDGYDFWGRHIAAAIIDEWRQKKV
mmetsp:Transcript_11579/g.24419  ORF Transcript_11579/g.24419 Transcript_11579/m.24419 type:complete len:492 (+) Transcript_11579:229-1704(+)